MLHDVVSGTPNLAPVLNQCRQARKAAGLSVLVSFCEHCALLSEQAQACDNANTRAESSCRRTADVHYLIDDDMECEANVHKADDCDNQEPDLSKIPEANVNAQCDKGTSRCVPRKQGGTSNQKRQADQMQGRRACVTQDTWNSIPKDDQVEWDSLSDKTKLTVTAHHFDKGKEHALRDAEANKMEAKQHDAVFDADDEDNNSVIEAWNHEVAPPQGNDADMTRKLHEEEGIDFEQILQAQKANTRLFTGVHELEPEEESDDDEEHTGLEVNSHWFMGFDDDEEKEGQEEFFDEITDVLDAFGATHANASSNASQGTGASNRNAAAVHNGNNTIASRTGRATSGNNDIASPRNGIPPVVPPVQEEKTTGDEQDEAEDEEECCQLATSLLPHLFNGTTSGNGTLEQTALPNGSPNPEQAAAPNDACPKATSPGRSGPNQHLTPVISAKPEAAAVENIANDPSPQQNPKQPGPVQASASNAS